MGDKNQPANAINRVRASKPKQPKVNKGPRKPKPRFVASDKRNMAGKSQRPGKRVERPDISSRKEARDHIKSLVTSLLSTTDMSSGDGVRVPRISSRPVAARKIPFSLQIPAAAFADGRLQVRFAPDMYRTCSYTHTSSGAIQPSVDSLWSDINFNLPNGVYCLNPDTPASDTRFIKFDAVRINSNSTYFTGNSVTNSPVQGAEALLFDSVTLPEDPLKKFIPKLTNYTGEDVQATCTILALTGAGLNAMRDIVYSLPSTTFTIGNGATVSGNFPDPQWATFTNLVNNNVNVKAMAFTFQIDNVNGGVVRDALVVGLDWSAEKPLFDGLPTWQVVSVFDALGEQGEVLKKEIDNVQFGVVTQMNIRMTDFVANLNKNGTVSATQLPACKLKGIPTNIGDAITAIDNLGIPEYSWKSLPEPDGLTWVCHFDSNEQWHRRPSKYLINRGTNLDDVDIPMAVIATDFSANIAPGSPHVIKIMGSLNYEWETTSLAFDLKFPPSNFSLFNEAYFQAITRECPFTHNPVHVKEIGKKIYNVMTHPVMQHVIRTVAEIGIGALMAV